MGPQKPKSPEPPAPDLNIGGPFAPPPPLATLPPSGIPTKTAATPKAQTRIKLQAKAKAKAAADEKKRVARLESDRQAAALQRAVSGRVSAKAGLTPTTDPFAGASKSGQGARAPVESELSANSQLAKRRLQLLGSGGLELPAPARKQEEAAIRRVSSSTAPTFADTHTLPWDLAKPSTRLTPAEDKRTLQAVEGAGVPTGKTVDTTHPGFFMSSMGKDYYGQGHPGPGFLRPTVWQAGLQSALDQLKSPGDVPNLPISLAWLKEIFSPADAAAAQKAGLTLHEFVNDETKYGKFQLGPTARKALTALMVKNGWNAKDAPNLTDRDLAARAFNKKTTGLMADARNAAGGLALFTSLPSAAELAGGSLIEDVRQRSLTPSIRFAAEVGQQWQNKLPWVGDRPWLENLQEDPVGTIAAILPPGKGASWGIGRFLLRLPRERTFVVPTIARNVAAKVPGFEEGDQFRTAPGSVHPLMRGYQVLGDRIMAKASTPEMRAAETRNLPRRVLGAPAAGARFVRHPLGQLGAHLEAGRVSQSVKQARQEGHLIAGHEASVALVRYEQAMRAFPWVARHMRLTGRQGEADAVSSVVFHGLIGKTSEQVAAYFDQQVTRSERLAEIYQGKAREQEAKALAAEKASGVQGEHEAATHRQNKAGWERAAEQVTTDASQQRAMAEWSRANPHDHLNPQKGERELLDQARNVSRQQDELRKQGKKFNDKGALYGRLQHNLAITLALEGPHFDELGQAVAGTPLWHEANLIMHPESGLRAEHNAARARLYGNDRKVEETLAAQPASRDSQLGIGPQSLRAAGPEHHLGRFNRLSQLQRFADAFMRQREHRAELRRQRAEGAIATGDSTPALTAASEHARAWGVDPSVLERMRTQASEALQVVTTRGDERAARAEKLSEGKARGEQAARTSEATSKIQALTRDKEQARLEGRPKDEIQAIDDQIAAISHDLQSAYRPGREVLQGQSQAEKIRLGHRLASISDADIERIIHDNLTPEQVQQIGYPVLHDMLSEQLDNAPHHVETYNEIGSRLAHASESYAALTGHSVEDAAAYQWHDQHYRQRLKVYDKMLQERGIHTGHIQLEHPDDLGQLPPVLVSRGVQFASGNFGRDVHLYLARDLSKLEARAAQGQMFTLLSDDPVLVRHAPRGEPAPPGFVAVSKEDWDNVTSSYPDSKQVATMLEGLKNPRMAVPPEGDQVFLSQNMVDQVKQAHKEHDPSSLNVLLKATNTYRRYMLYMLPRTWVNNAVGNPVMAMIVGASARDWHEAIWTLRNHPERVMGTLRSRGPIANAASTGRNIFGWQAFWRHHNTFQEDNGNLMVYLLHARKQFKKDNNLRWFNRVSKMDDLWHDFLVKAAKGENPDAYAWGRKSAQAFGDMSEHWKADPGLATLFLFHRWVSHMIFLTLWSLPIHYPGRFAFLVQAGELAHQYEQKHGVWPPWAAGMLPLLHATEKLPGGIQHMVWALSTQGLNPFATPSQTFDLGDVGQPKFPGQSLVAANINPLLRIGGEFASGRRADTLQEFKDQYGDPVGGFSWRQLANNVIANTPGLNTVTSRGGLSDESIQLPFIGQSHPRYSSISKYDPSFAAPSAFGHAWWIDWLLRAGAAAGAPVRPLDTEGPRSARSITATEKYLQKQQTLRRTHRQQANTRMLGHMTLDERKAWMKKNDPQGFARGDYNRFGAPAP